MFKVTQLFALLFLLMPSLLFASNSVDGKWEGSIELPGMSLNVVVHLETDADGSLKGKIDIPQQQAMGLVLTNLSLSDKTIKFSISGIPGDPTFNGEWDDNVISGLFSQGGASFSFTIERESAEESEAKKLELNEFLDTLKEAVIEGMEYWNIPGASVAIVKDGEVVLSEGFGYRNIEAKLPVTTNTQFAIGSTSKAFTALGLSILEEEGLIKWNEPIITYLPDFRMHDEFATLRINSIDILSHQSGLPRHDLAWYASGRSRAELYNALNYLEPTYDIRTQFQYQNLMYMLAGVLIEQRTGQSWEEFTGQRIFGPLEMKNSNFSVVDMNSSPDASLAYAVKDNEVFKIPYHNIDAMGPAGSINSTSDDMAKWLKFLLNEGKIGDNEILSSSTIKKTFEPQIALTASTGDMKSSSYGLGWFVNVYKGHLVYQHGGGIDGFITEVALFPEVNAGLVVLTNNMSNALGTLVHRLLFDYLHDKEPVDWKARLMPARSDEPDDNDEDKQLTTDDRITGTNPSLNISEYTGDFLNPGYGTIQISSVDNLLVGTFNAIPFNINHWHFDVFEAVVNLNNSETKLKIQFQMDVGGNIKSLSIPLEATASPIIFERKADDKFSTTEYLNQFTGNYTLATQRITIRIAGGNLRLSITNQPTYTLNPISENLFQVDNMDGFRIRFEMDESDKAQRAIFLQPNGRYEAIRSN